MLSDYKTRIGFVKLHANIVNYFPLGRKDLYL